MTIRAGAKFLRGVRASRGTGRFARATALRGSSGSIYTPKHLAEKILHDTIAASARGLGAGSPLRSFAWISARGSGGSLCFFGLFFLRFVARLLISLPLSPG